MKRERVTRRWMLRSLTVSAAAVPLIVQAKALGLEGATPASERVTLGHIGVGGRGRDLLRGFLTCPGAQPLAVADAYRDRRDAMAEMIKGKAYGDFREILARDDIDTVVIATPDHWHVPIAVMAARAGKHAYVEKPLGLTVQQNLICRKVFQETKRVFQYGTQQRSMAHCRFGCVDEPLDQTDHEGQYILNALSHRSEQLLPPPPLRACACLLHTKQDKVF